MIKHILLISVLFLIISCNKNNPNKVDDKVNCNNLMTPQEMILGNWLWEITYKSWGGGTLTPDSENYHIELEYNKDTLYYFKNNQLLFKTYYFWEYKYHSGHNDTIFVLKIQPVENVNENVQLADFSIVNCDSLIFDSSSYDGPRVVYKRK